MSQEGAPEQPKPEAVAPQPGAVDGQEAAPEPDEAGATDDDAEDTESEAGTENTPGEGEQRVATPSPPEIPYTEKFVEGVGDAVIPPGNDELLARMLGKGEMLPGQCKFTGGNVERSSIYATYGCASGEVALQLHHPKKAPPNPVKQTAEFAITVKSGSPPAGLLDAVESHIKANEASFKWSWTSVKSPGAPPAARSRILLAVAGVLLAVILTWVLLRRGGRTASTPQP